MAELADALDLGSSVNRREGSSPFTRTIPSVLTGLKGFCIALGFFICFSACTGGIVNIYALSRMYRYIIFR